LIASCFDTVYDYLEAKRQRGELPSDVKAQFIDDLISSETCICGRPLKEGTHEYYLVLAKKASAGRNELDDAYHRLTSYISYQKGIIGNFFPEYHDLNTRIDDLNAEKDTKNRRLKEISHLLKNSDEDEIAARENQRESFKSDIKKLSEIIAKLGVEYDTVNKRIVEKDRELKNVKLKGEQAGLIQKRRNMTSRLGELNQKIRAYFIDTTRSNLDKRIREVFDSMKEKEYRYARLTDDFVLEITNDIENQDDSRILSTGEGQIASLAFIGSLVSYAKEKQQDKLMSDFNGGDFPVVMDSPFGNLSTGHKGNVAREIGKLASQVIVIVSDEQWSSIVEENIRPRLGILYKMEDGSDGEQSTGEHTVVRRI
jgi:DNA sulfur modification protein DndD